MRNRRHRPAPVVQAQPPANLRELLQHLDLRELLTGVLVVSAALIGSQAAPTLFAQSRDIVITQVMFEFPMALLAVFAGYAEKRSARALRATILLFGAAAVLAIGFQHALIGGAPAAILPGLWLVYARLAPPGGVVWFSVRHCQIVSIVAGSAWAMLIGALMLLMILGALAPSGAHDDEAASWVYALVWGGFYLALAFAMPAVRRRLLPAAKAGPKPRAGLARSAGRRCAG